MINIDTTRLDSVKPAKQIYCEVTDLDPLSRGAGTIPREIEVKLRDEDGPKQICQWYGYPPVEVGTEVVCWRAPGDTEIMRVAGAGGGSTGTVVKNNYSASAAPGTGDDVNDGYGVGSVWVDTTNDNTYMCTDNTASAANWVQTNGSGGGDFEEIASYHLTTGTNVNVDFTNIPATYTHLELRGNVRLDGISVAATYSLRFNNDSGSNYDYIIREIDGSGTQLIGETSAGRSTSANIARANASFSTANVPSLLHLIVPNYARTDQNKLCTAWSSTSGADSSNTHFEQLRVDAWWHSTAAINRITLVATVAADTHLTLYGLNST